MTRFAAGEKKSFELSEWIILGRGSRNVRIIVLYQNKNLVLSNEMIKVELPP